MIKCSHRCYILVLLGYLVSVVHRSYEIHTENMISGQFIVINETTIVNIGFKLFDKTIIHTSVNRTFWFHLPVPTPEGVLHEYTESFSYAEVRKIEEMT